MTAHQLISDIKSLLHAEARRQDASPYKRTAKETVDHLCEAIDLRYLTWNHQEPPKPPPNRSRRTGPVHHYIGPEAGAGAEYARRSRAAKAAWETRRKASQ